MDIPKNVYKYFIECSSDCFTWNTTSGTHDDKIYWLKNDHLNNSNTMMQLFGMEFPCQNTEDFTANDTM